MSETKRIVYVHRTRPKKKEEEKPKRRIPTLFGMVKIFFFLFVAAILFKRFDIRLFPFFSKPQTSAKRDGRAEPERPRAFLADDTAPAAVPPSLESVRIAFWNLDPFDLRKIADPVIGRRVAQIVAENDLTALVGIRSSNRAMLNALLYRLNGRWEEPFAALVSPPNSFDESAAFIYRTDRIAADTERTLFLTDGAGRYRPPIYAAAFAVRPIQPKQTGQTGEPSFELTERPEKKAESSSASTDRPNTPARTAVSDESPAAAVRNRFTFTAVTFRVDPNSAPCERGSLADIYRAVRENAGRSGVAEDDILLLGSLDAEREELDDLRTIPNLATVNDRFATQSAGKAVDHIIFDTRASAEYLERYGVTDLAERFAIAPEEAKKIAEHWPIWAEFSAVEN